MLFKDKRGAAFLDPDIMKNKHLKIFQYCVGTSLEWEVEETQEGA